VQNDEDLVCLFKRVIKHDRFLNAPAHPHEQESVIIGSFEKWRDTFKYKRKSHIEIFVFERFVGGVLWYMARGTRAMAREINEEGMKKYALPGIPFFV